MRQPNRTWILMGSMLLCLVVGCESAYTYIPSTSKTVPAPAPGPAAVEEPAPGPAAARAQEPQAGLAQQVQALQERVQRLEGQLAELEARKGYPPPPREAAAPGQETAGAPAPKASPAMEKAYAEGLRLYKNKKYDAAREKFHQYLKGKPQGPRDAEARFYLADSFYLEGHYKDAATEFHKVVAQHPQSVLAPAALLRQAYSYQKMRQTQNYQNALKQLVQTYPKSPEAKAAKEQLKSR
jgi:tol-pal system protein YbgF